MSRKVSKTKFRNLRDQMFMAADSIIAKRESNLRLVRYMQQNVTGLSLSEAFSRINKTA